MKKHQLLSLSALSWLSVACTSLYPDEHANTEKLGDSPSPGYGQNRFSNHNMQDVYQKAEVGDINHYVQGLMHDLMANIDQPEAKMDIGVTSFVYLDGAFDHTDILGVQLSESFMHELHQFGLNVLDFKVTDYIRVTPTGDFNFSRDYLDLNDQMAIKYVLGGTLVKHQDGVLVNARLVSITSKKVLSTAQGFIPTAVVNGLQKSESNNGISLKFKQNEKS